MLILFSENRFCRRNPYTFVSFKALCDYDRKEARIFYNMKSVFKLTQ
jgi:hypothetical protein